MTNEDAAFEHLLNHINESRGFDFTGYKRASLKRRIDRRLQQVEIVSYEEYLDYLEVHPEEFVLLFNTILINVTSFFRDPQAWEYLAQEILPDILGKKEADDPIRTWCAGCASGEEAYTLAILLHEALGAEAFRRQVKIYATDVDEEALLHARQARYSSQALETVPAALRDKYFEFNSGSYVIQQDLRRGVIFGRHDLVQDAPISHLDLLICRNTLMYFNSEVQARILARLHFALDDNGYLFLGKAEMLLTHANLFTPVELKHRIFRKVPKVNLRDRLLLLAQAGNEEAGDRLASRVRLREAAIDAAPIAQIVVDRDGKLALVNKTACLMFALHQTRDMGQPLQDLEISYRPLELRSLIEQAYAARRSILRSGVERHLSNGEVQHLDVRITPLEENGGGLIGVTITYDDVTTNQQLQTELKQSNQDLETAYEELQSTNEELETTNEELQSTVEELETTNEELQSTNEELETMNEELQSTNEELQTMNDELRERTNQLNEVNAFLSSILTSLRSGIVVLDRNANILIWNSWAEELWGLRPEEVEGYSFYSLDIGLPVEELTGPVRACLKEETEYEEQVLEAVNRRGKAFRCRVICTPLSDTGGKGKGVILVMEEA